jgi:hypothetical protein
LSPPRRGVRIRQGRSLCQLECPFCWRGAAFGGSCGEKPVWPVVQAPGRGARRLRPTGPYWTKRKENPNSSRPQALILLNVQVFFASNTTGKRRLRLLKDNNVVAETAVGQGVWTEAPEVPALGTRIPPRLTLQSPGGKFRADERRNWYEHRPMFTNNLKGGRKTPKAGPWRPKTGRRADSNR